MKDIALLLKSQAVYSTWGHQIGDIRFDIDLDSASAPTVVIQGTEDLAEVFTDLHFLPKRGSDGQEAHAGITDRAEAVLAYLKTVLNGPVIFTGHSLGAGLAERLAALWPWSCTVVAFEPPAISWGLGMRLYMAGKPGLTARAYGHANDPVISQPPLLLGWHQAVLLDYFGKQCAEPKDAHDIANLIADAPNFPALLLDRSPITNTDMTSERRSAIP